MPAKKDRVDVLVVGAGASGAAFARSLAKAGIGVLCLEQGGWMDPSTYPAMGERVRGPNSRRTAASRAGEAASQGPRSSAWAGVAAADGRTARVADLMTLRLVRHAGAVGAYRVMALRVGNPCPVVLGPPRRGRRVVASTGCRLSQLVAYGMVRAMSSEPGHAGTFWRLSRRELMRWAGAMLAGPAAGMSRPLAARAGMAAPGRDPDEILRGLVAGNERFATDQATGPRRRPEDFLPLAEGQTPVAVIVGCADSRVPPEVIFDQGVGDLFVVRAAGNVVSGAGAIVKGSIEYAVAELGVPVIMVLGHASCGAIKAALKHIETNDRPPGSLGDLVKILRPVAAGVKGKSGDPLDNAIRANVAVGVQRLKTLDPILAPAVAQKRLKVVGGVYDLKTGRVSMVA